MSDETGDYVKRDERRHGEKLEVVLKDEGRTRGLNKEGRTQSAKARGET